MLTFNSRRSSGKTCDGVTRRDFLKLGGLCVGGLTLADVLRAQGRRESTKAVIMVWLEGGPSHIDTYDLKPDAPAEIRGPFRPIQTNVAGMNLCELMPLQAKVADKLAIIRNMTYQNNDHSPPEELLTGFLKGNNRPALGSVVSRLQADAGKPRLLPAYVQLDSLHDPAERLSFPAFLGGAHKPFVPGKSLKTLELSRDVSAEQLSDRRQLLQTFDTLRRDIDTDGSLASKDVFTAQALEMISSTRARDAFDISRESAASRERYGPATQLLQARRLVEAGVSVVSVSFVGSEKGRKAVCGFGGGTWDTHGNLDKCLGHLLPQLDHAVHALATDLHERGLDKDVAVVFWGEMGRSPRITPNPNRTPGRGHWPQAGFALMLGGGLRMGQVVGGTDRHGGHPAGNPCTAQNVLATLYHALGIDPAATTIPDHTGRPVYLLDDTQPIAELV